MNQKQYTLKQNWKTVLGSRKLAEALNDIARVINGTGYMIGGDSILTKDGLQLRGKGGSSGDSHLGFHIYLADGTSFTVTRAQAMTGYDPVGDPVGPPIVPPDTNWSLEFSVTDGVIDDYAASGAPSVMTNPIGTNAMDDGASTAGTELYDGDAGATTPVAQTYYRIPIIRGTVTVSGGGAYRENIKCVGSRGPIVELIKIG